MKKTYVQIKTFLKKNTLNKKVSKKKEKILFEI